MALLGIQALLDNRRFLMLRFGTISPFNRKIGSKLEGFSSTYARPTIRPTRSVRYQARRCGVLPSPLSMMLVYLKHYKTADSPLLLRLFLPSRTCVVTCCSVENCQIIGESSRGTGLAQAFRKAAWRFLVKTPRIDNKPQLGVWVRTHSDFRTKVVKDDDVPAER